MPHGGRQIRVLADRPPARAASPPMAAVGAVAVAVGGAVAVAVAVAAMAVVPLRLLAVEAEQRPKLGPAVLQLSVVLLGHDLVQEPRYWVGDRPEEKLQGADKGHEGGCDAELVGPREDRRWQDLAADEHDGHRHDDGQEWRQELVQKERQRLVGNCVEEQQGDQQHVVILDQRQHKPGALLIPSQLFPLLPGLIVARSALQEDLEPKGV
mmetsp:Transcript_7927/g.24037  ORF Transcript_7927/g.24037 Transcript_7927/m.24037 type:complete len:210 (-) Transcript_7927:1100-1729(-)